MLVAIKAGNAVIAYVGEDDETEKFSPSRYPYTYAYDLLRNHLRLLPSDVLAQVPGGVNSLPSRAETSHIVKSWAALLGVDTHDLIVGLADAFLTLNHIRRPY